MDGNAGAIMDEPRGVTNVYNETCEVAVHATCTRDECTGPLTIEVMSHFLRVGQFLGFAGSCCQSSSRFSRISSYRHIAIHSRPHGQYIRPPTDGQSASHLLILRERRLSLSVVQNIVFLGLLINVIARLDLLGRRNMGARRDRRGPGSLERLRVDAVLVVLRHRDKQAREETTAQAPRGGQGQTRAPRTMLPTYITSSPHSTDVLHSTVI